MILKSMHAPPPIVQYALVLNGPSYLMHSAIEKPQQLLSGQPAIWTAWTKRKRVTGGRCTESHWRRCFHWSNMYVVRMFVMRLSREHSHPNVSSRLHNHDGQLNLLHSTAKEIVASSMTLFSQAIVSGRSRTLVRVLSWSYVNLKHT